MSGLDGLGWPNPEDESHRRPSAADDGSADYRRGYSAGYQAGVRRGRLESPSIPIPNLNIERETGDGYVCAACSIQRPRTWYVYEIERVGDWLTPCCAICARKEKSRGPFPQNPPISGGIPSAASSGSGDLEKK